MFQAIETLREHLAPHYDIQREIGAGGMARVYLALEQHPSRRVAIKVLDPDVSTRLLRERFLREVDVASKLTHPHILPIFAAGEAAGVFYYVMPYIEGESLRLRLLRERRLPLETALHIARDVADALAFAHAQGIIHRDIKPENILLSADHAVVADFGIARAISAAGHKTLTQTGQSIGSPGYMSPEQAFGLPTDARSDIYSLGCVLFEMLAGEAPVPKLNEPLIHNWAALSGGDTLRGSRGVVRAVKHAISTALAPLPDGRFATAVDFGAALGSDPHRSSLPTRSRLVGRRRWRLVAASALGAVVLAAAAIASISSAVLDDGRVVVGLIENRTGDPALDNLGRMTADWVTQGLSQTGLVEVVPSLSAMMTAGAVAQDSRTAGGDNPGGGTGSLLALARETGAATVVSGAYYRHGDSVQFHVQIVAGKDGKILRALDPVGASLSRPLDGVELVRQRVMAALATMFDARLSRWATKATQPPNFQAYHEFIAGLDRFVQFDPRGAIAHFTRAVAVDSSFQLPLIFAANAQMNVGDFAAADSLARVVSRHADRLAPLDRNYLAWVTAVCRGDAEEAFRASRAMAELAPASEALYLVAGDAMRLNRPGAAVTALQTLGPDRGFTSGWWVYWDDLTRAHHMLGDYRNELKEAREGTRRFPDNPQMVSAQARALAGLGRPDGVERLLAETATLSRDRGWGAADVMLMAALELRTHGHRAAAETTIARMDAVTGPLGAAASSAERYRAALTWYVAGRLDDARREFETLATRREAAGPDVYGLDLVSDLDYQGYLAAIAARQGRRDVALHIEAALATTSRPYLFGRHTMWRARIRALLGEREAALALVRESLSQGYHAHALHTDVDLEGLRGFRPYEDLLKPKG